MAIKQVMPCHCRTCGL